MEVVSFMVTTGTIGINMKITLDLKEFEQALLYGIKAMFNGEAHIVDVITPFGTFHINKESAKRQPLYNELMDYIKKQSLVLAIKTFRTNTGVGLKAAKDFCELLRDNEEFGIAWLNGDDDRVNKLFGYSDIDPYNIWKSHLEA